MMEILTEIFEGLRFHGRKGGAVSLIIGVILLASAFTLADETERLYRGTVEFIVALVALGIAGIGTGLWLLSTGGTPRRGTPHRRSTRTEADELRDSLASLRLPYALCVPCKRVVKSWSVHACPRCSGDLLDIQTEDDVAWAQETLAPQR